MRPLLVRTAHVLSAVVRLALALAATGLVAMTAMIAWQVFSRYILNDSPSWTEALAILVMAWFIFLGAAVGVRENFHMGFDVLVYVLPKGAAPVLQTISDLAVLVFGGGMAWYGLQLVRRTWSDHIPGVGFPRGVGYLPLTVGGVLVCLFVLERIARRLAGLPAGDAPEPEDAGAVAAHEA
jgi:TRAP-type C4-dicarboxylate transport system permease small subunit